MSSSLTASIDSFRHAGTAAPLFRDMRLSLQESGCLLVSGPGGCGKTSLCHLLANVIPGVLSSGEFQGSVSVNNTTITGLPLARSALFVGLLLQAPERQLCHLSVAEDITFGPENLALPPARIREILVDLARLLNLEPLLQRSPHTLSSGEAQRVALAATLALNPPVLVFDHPTAHLDGPSRRAFYQLVARLCRQEGKIVVIADTDLRLGEIESLATQRLDLPAANKLPESVSSKPLAPAAARAPLAPPAPMMPAASLAPPPAPADIEAGALREPLLALEDVSFAYARDRPALEIDACTINPGEMVVLLGENGSGKTTLLRMLAGLCTPQTGTIRLLGRDITRLSPARRSAQIAYLPRNPDLLLSRNSVAEELEAALRRGPATSGSVRGWLEQAGLLDHAAANPLTLSHGERYRLALAVLLARAPALLLLDEPTSVLDRAETALLCRLITAFCAAGRSALVVTHDPAHLAAHGVIRRALYLADHRLSEAALGADNIFSQRRPYEHSIVDRTGYR